MKMARGTKKGVVCLLLTVVLLILAITNHRNVRDRNIMSPLNAQVQYHAGSFQSPKQLNCQDQICSQFLTDGDMPHWKYCWRKTKLYKEPERSMCHFVNGSERYPVALASFPGSGNTWVRGLLQQITGVCTGAIYCDTTLRQRGFPGEGIRSGIALVVKTHQTDPRWSGVTYSQSEPFKYFKRLRDVPVYSAAILIVRNPYDALVAEWHRIQPESVALSHVAYVGLEHFRENTAWDKYVHKWAVTWQDTIVGWLLKNKQHPVMVVKFEELKRNTATEVMKMMHFLQVPYTKGNVLEVASRGFTEFRRKRHLSPSECYTSRQVEHVRDVLKATATLLETHNLTHLCNILDYDIRK